MRSADRGNARGNREPGGRGERQLVVPLPAGLSTTSPLRGQQLLSTTMHGPQQLPPLVPECSLTEAARLLGVDRRTVKKLIKADVLRVRVAGLPTSLRPRYRIPQSDVLALRNEYHRVASGARRAAKTSKKATTKQLVHIHLDP